MSTAAFGILILAPVVVGVLSAVPSSPRRAGWVSLAGSIAYGLAWFIVAVHAARGGAIYRGPFYLDGLGAFMAGLISIVATLSAAYSVGFMVRETELGETTVRHTRIYYLFYHLFIAGMYSSICVNSLGLMWVAIELTTLTSALLVAHHGTRHSLEAAWKYLVLCSLGIAFALFGTVLLYHGATLAGISPHSALNWSTLRGVAPHLDPGLMKLAFIFLLVGYGTKAGLAPMHTWLPDAHSEVPTPVSAVLSAVLLNCALYAVLRAASLVAASAGSPFVGNLLVGFGLVSLVVSVPFMMIQKDLKRLLAYSSIEHVGIMAMGFGLGFSNPAGATGAFIHMFFHALGKVLLFFVAGCIVQRYGTKRMHRIRGLMGVQPFLGTALLMGSLAIVGMPPFGLFLSEFAIAAAGFVSGHALATSAFLVLLALSFGAIIYHVGGMVFGEPRARERQFPSHEGLDALTILTIVVPIVLLVGFGLHIPTALRTAVSDAVASLRLL